MGAGMGAGMGVGMGVGAGAGVAGRAESRALQPAAAAYSTELALSATLSSLDAQMRSLYSEIDSAAAQLRVA
eukprot:2852324-Prymnesium_polylepis.1